MDAGGEDARRDKGEEVGRDEKEGLCVNIDFDMVEKRGVDILLSRHPTNLLLGLAFQLAKRFTIYCSRCNASVDYIYMYMCMKAGRWRSNTMNTPAMAPGLVSVWKGNVTLMQLIGNEFRNTPIRLFAKVVNSVTKLQFRGW